LIDITNDYMSGARVNGGYMFANALNSRPSNMLIRSSDYGSAGVPVVTIDYDAAAAGTAFFFMGPA
jgi:hypothetical protein